MNRERFRFFPATHHESDLLIGISHGNYREEIRRAAFNELVRLRAVLDQYMEQDPLLAGSLEPVPLPRTSDGEDMMIPEEIACMIRCGEASGTGPMSSVAGLFAEQVGMKLIRDYLLKEVVIENGGDLFIRIESEACAVIHAGTSPLSDKLGLVITPGTWGICTSSGTMGHSFSGGRADAVTVVAPSTPLADAWATSLANRVSSADDIDPVLELAGQIPQISGCAIIVGDRMGIRGDFEVKLLS